MHYVYVLKSAVSDKHYVGSTADLRMRILSHQKGSVRSTKAHRPWKLVYYEAHATKYLAEKTEKFYKTGQGRRQLKKKLEEE